MKLTDFIKQSDPALRRNLVFFLISYFFVLFNYPLVRASSTTLFFEAYGAKSSPIAWLWGVLFLSLAVIVCDRLQSRLSVQKVFGIVSFFSSLLFFASTLGFLSGIKFLTYLPFTWKEIYIVIQVHLLLAYANNILKKEDFKLLVGPIGAIGSLGGILGGWLTGQISSGGGTIQVMWVALFFVSLPAVFFFFTPSLRKAISSQVRSPLASLTPDIRKYVWHIAGVVALTQFVINIADFNFNIAFESAVSDATARTTYLGHVYMVTNALTFAFQFLLLPFLLTRISERSLHIFIPLSYMASLGILLLTGSAGFIPVAMFYVYLKASDYSFFSAAKEILYQPLGISQKYGAKYLTDMLVYRVSKAMIAAVLIYLQSSTILIMMMGIFLTLWVGLIFRLFRLHRQLFS